MERIRLMNRMDMKFVLSLETLQRLLPMASRHYRVQEVAGERDIAYRTVYLDTPALTMYEAHLHGRATREKIRVRTYLPSGLTFLEVKRKNNKGRTDKKRVKVSGLERLQEEGGTEFLQRHARFGLEEIAPRLENRFHRITLVNLALTERLTIDSGIRFLNLTTGNERALERVVVMELKRDARTPSPIRGLLQELHVRPAGFSKYCMGCAMTDDKLRANRFKPRIRNVLSINNSYSDE
ncbi:MAG: polyphosphate polymerase domain-containing protein [Prevotellaceae bacterium]|nr:polyphosphate polymerase domain-containing protein [Prevotellaceae bacterium]